MNKEEILDILEDGKSLTKNQQGVFEEDADVSQLVEDVLLGVHSIRDEHLPSEEVQARLDAFHQTHSQMGGNEKSKTALLHLLWVKALIGVAAASAIVVLLLPFGKGGNTVVNVSEQGIIASANQHHSESKLIATDADAVTHERQITSEDIDAYFSRTDTVLLNVDRGQQCKIGRASCRERV